MIRARRTAMPIGFVIHKFRNRDGTIRKVSIPVFGTVWFGLTPQQKAGMTVADFRAIAVANRKRERRQIRNIRIHGDGW